MLDFENGVIDLVKRIDNVTIKLTDLFFKLENELTKLYFLSNNNSGSCSFEKKNENNKPRSELGERMRELLKEGFMCGNEYRSSSDNNDSVCEDDLLVAIDNSVICLESLTSAVLGARLYTDCLFFVGEESEEGEGRAKFEEEKLRTEGVCELLDELKLKGIEVAKHENGQLGLWRGERGEFGVFRERGNKKERFNGKLSSDFCYNNSRMATLCENKIEEALHNSHEWGKKNKNNKYGRTEINENSVLISLCRSISRLTRHRLDIEKYDCNVNKELERIGREKCRELESRLIETEKRLKEREIKCYEYEKKIKSIEYKERIMYDDMGLLDITSSSVYFKQGSSGEIQKDEVLVETAFQSPRTDLVGVNLLPGNDVDINMLENQCSLGYENEHKSQEEGDLFVDNGKAVAETKTSSFENESCYHEEKNREIMQLKDQIQILNTEMLLLREENERLNGVIMGAKKGYKEEGKQADEDFVFRNSKGEVARERKSEILFDILYGGEDQLQAEMGIQLFSDKDTGADKNTAKTGEMKGRELEIDKQEEVRILNFDAGNTEGSNLSRVGCDFTESGTPYLVMWDPIIDTDKHVRNNVVPISISSYGEFKSSRKGKTKSVNAIKYLLCENKRPQGQHSEDFAEKTQCCNSEKFNNEEATNAGEKLVKKGERIKINRNSFYSDIEKIIKRNT